LLDQILQKTFPVTPFPFNVVLVDFIYWIGKQKVIMWSNLSLHVCFVLRSSGAK